MSEDMNIQTFAEQIAVVQMESNRRLELLRRCKEEMETSVEDFEVNINPWLEAAGYHPVTQTPRAMTRLIDELAKELVGVS